MLSTRPASVCLLRSSRSCKVLLIEPFATPNEEQATFMHGCTALDILHTHSTRHPVEQHVTRAYSPSHDGRTICLGDEDHEPNMAISGYMKSVSETAA